MLETHISQLGPPGSSNLPEHSFESKCGKISKARVLQFLSLQRALLSSCTLPLVATRAVWSPASLLVFTLSPVSAGMVWQSDPFSGMGYWSLWKRDSRLSVLLQGKR